MGFTIPASGMTYWVGEARKPTDYKDASRQHMAAASTAHLARLLRAENHPGLDS